MIRVYGQLIPTTDEYLEMTWRAYSDHRRVCDKCGMSYADAVNGGPMRAAFDYCATGRPLVEWAETLSQIFTGRRIAG